MAREPNDAYDALRDDVFHSIVAPDFKREVCDVATWRRRWRKIANCAEGAAQVAVGFATLLAFAEGFFQVKYLAFAAGCASALSLVLFRFSAYAERESGERNAILARLLLFLGIPPPPPITAEMALGAAERPAAGLAGLRATGVGGGFGGVVIGGPSGGTVPDSYGQSLSFGRASGLAAARDRAGTVGAAAARDRITAAGAAASSASSARDEAAIPSIATATATTTGGATGGATGDGVTSGDATGGATVDGTTSGDATEDEFVTVGAAIPSAAVPSAAAALTTGAAGAAASAAASAAATAAGAAIPSAAAALTSVPAADPPDVPIIPPVPVATRADVAEASEDSRLPGNGRDD